MANILFRVKTKSGHHVVKDLTENHTINDLKQTLSQLSDIPVGRLQVLSGFPPKNLDITQDHLKLVTSGLKSGDTLILQEAAVAITQEKPAQKLEQEVAINDDGLHAVGILMKYVVPADNSCLFTSIHFVLNGKLDESGEAPKFLRHLVAETIRNAKDKYDEAILGKPIDEYCTWIKNDTSWGGAIELAILSEYYGLEIAVVDTINAIINRFGEDQNYALRVFLMFDGIHYDPLYLEPINGDKIQTLFESQDEKTLQDAKLLAEEAKSSRQFTDVNKFTLKCMICNVMLKGQLEAQAHAKETDHMSFGEV